MGAVAPVGMAPLPALAVSILVPRVWWEVALALGVGDILEDPEHNYGDKYRPVAEYIGYT